MTIKTIPGPVVLFGATGFIGRHLLKSMEDAGIDVRLPKSASGDRLDISGAVEVLEESLVGAEIVVNAAGQAHLHSDTPAAFWPANALGAWRIAEAVVNSDTVRRLVHVSSVAVGAGGLEPPAADYQPTTAYGASKAAGEIAVAEALRDSDIDLVVLRPAGIGGIDSPGSWGTIRRLAAAGKRVPVPNNEVRHDVVEIEDVVGSLIDAISGNTPPGIYALAGDAPVTLAEYAEEVVRESDTGARVVRVSTRLLYAAGGVSSILQRALSPARRIGQLVDTLTNQRPLVTRERTSRQ